MNRTASQQTHKELRLIPTEKWVRARLGGTFIADSTRARLLFKHPMPRAYAFPERDVRTDLIVNETKREDNELGRIRDADLKVGDRVVSGALRFYDSGPAADAGLADKVTVDWHKMDAWYEEDEEVYVHPRDPGKRIDALKSSRHVVIKLDGTTLAESHKPVLLFEPPLPVRYYLPQTDVRLELLRESDTVTGCPYKGFASYNHVELDGDLYEDLVWKYVSPFQEVVSIKGMLCFYQEKLHVEVDGKPQERPKTPWS